MFRTFLTCMMLLLFNWNVNAQSSFVKPLIFGAKLGMNGSIFTADVDFFDLSSNMNDPSFSRFLRLAAYGGVTVDYMITDRFSVGAEVLYNARGMAYRQENSGVITIGTTGKPEQSYNYFKYKIDYVELPLTAGYNVLDVASNSWLMGYVGLAPAIAVKKEAMFDNANGLGPLAGKADASGELDHVRGFNTSILAGIQYGAVPGAVGTYIDFRASYTMLPVFTESKNTRAENLRTQMLTVSLGLGIKF